MLHEVEENARPITVTRDGVEVARIIPLSAAERLWRSWVREGGGDPDDPRYRRQQDASAVTGRPGASRALTELREHER